MMAIDLPIIWAFIIAFAVFVYVVMDGFDLGLGILFPLFPEKKDRDVIMNSVAPVWDGNETWLVLGGGGLMAAFPLAYAILMPALYTPMIVMLLGLVFRGVAFEFRWRTQRERNLWDIAFAGGSMLATPRRGTTIPSIPAAVAVRRIIPTLAGVVIPSRTSTVAGRAASPSASRRMRGATTSASTPWSCFPLPASTFT